MQLFPNKHIIVNETNIAQNNIHISPSVTRSVTEGDTCSVLCPHHKAWDKAHYMCALLNFQYVYHMAHILNIFILLADKQL